MKTPILALLTFLALGATQAAKGQQVQINTKVLSIPLDAALLKEAGLTLDAAEGLSNLGVISGAKVTALLARLEKTQGVTVLTVPSIVTKAGTRATAESTREFIYPTEFTPPKLSNATELKTLQSVPSQGIAASPSAPTAFEMRRTGVRVECEPTLGKDGTTIDLKLAPELVTFEGFINYGNAVNAAVADKDGRFSQVTLTENQVLQPVFQTVRTVTVATIPSGHCLILGGQGAGAGALPAAGQKPDLFQIAQPGRPSSHVIFFFVQSKVFTP